MPRRTHRWEYIQLRVTLKIDFPVEDIRPVREPIEVNDIRGTVLKNTETAINTRDEYRTRELTLRLILEIKFT